MRQPIMTIKTPEITEKTVARPLRGHTMGAIEDGWLIYYDDNETPPRPEIDGKLCVVLTGDNRLLTRKVRKAWVPDHWDLLTITGEQRVNQRLVWAELVKMIVPHDLSDEEKALIAAESEYKVW